MDFTDNKSELKWQIFVCHRFYTLAMCPRLPKMAFMGKNPIVRSALVQKILIFFPKYLFGTHGSGIEPVKTNDLPFWTQFIVCKINRISKDGPKKVQLGT